MDGEPATASPQTRPAGWFPASHGNSATPDYTRLFALDRVHEVRISIDAATFRAMREDLNAVLPLGAPGPETGRGGGLASFAGGLRMTRRDPAFFPVTVTHDGRVWTRVGMRYKGNWSLLMGTMMQSAKLSFRLDFDQFEDAYPEIGNQRFYGFNELSFSSNFDDVSRMREALANELFRDRGVPAPRVAFCRIFVNTGSGDQHWGLYTLVEDPADAAMLTSQFGGALGNLYKPDGPGADWTKFDPAGFEKKTNKTKADFSDIQAAIAALHADRPSAEWRASLERQFDVDLFLRWLAVNQVVDNWDTYGRLAHNYYLYADPGRNGRLVWIPWDNNYSFGLAPFGFGNFAGAPPAGDRATGSPRSAPPTAPVPLFGSNDDVLFEKVGAGWPLISKLLADPIYMTRYRAHLRLALGGLSARERLSAQIGAWQKLIASSVESDAPVSTFGQGTGDFLRSVNALLTAVERRRTLIEGALNR